MCIISKILHYEMIDLEVTLYILASQTLNNICSDTCSNGVDKQWLIIVVYTSDENKCFKDPVCIIINKYSRITFVKMLFLRGTN